MAYINAGYRLDRVPITRFHRRVFALVGIGMFLDGFDIYLAGTVLGATIKSGFATMEQGALFVSATFVGMMLGSLVAGFVGDRFGRAFTYQINLALFGLASLAAGFAPNMDVLIVLRLLMGLGLGAENVVGYAALTEFFPGRFRGRWLGTMAMIVALGLPSSILLSTYLIPAYGWRVMFIAGGIGGLVIWWVRKRLPESPRWLEVVGRNDEAEELLLEVEEETGQQWEDVSGKNLTPSPSRGLTALFRPPLLRHMVVGSVTLMIINAVVFGFITWLPTFFIRQGMSMIEAFHFVLVMAIGAPLGAFLASLAADRLGRKPTVALACVAAMGIAYIYPNIRDPMMLPPAGLALTAAIFALMAMLFGIYIPELFPTEVRLRAAGICNMLGRGATIFTPFLVISMFDHHGIAGVTTAMIALLGVLAVVVVLFGVESRERRSRLPDRPPAIDRRTQRLAAISSVAPASGGFGRKSALGEGHAAAERPGG
ncbi:MAG TPA: MFS transporter [Acetobacteraceae bacterium]|nr:MFS transporter [Acetobacteraceae bacterium]